MTALRLILVLGAASCLAACSNTQTRSIVETPMAPPLASAPLNVNAQGAIYQAGAPLLLYETPRAQHIGDVLTIRLSESYSGNNSASASANRASSITATAADQSTNAAARLAKLFNIGSASTDYKGQGNLRDISDMTGTLAVTVIGTVSGGNLVVSGEKVIAMSGTRDRLRLSGIVNPKDIEAGNYVASSKVANARIEQAGLGMVNDATTMGWLQRMFLSVLTF
ncbi:flagellar L-ring protein precursor FlgH [Paraburkholderia youngii]|uniref:Flagellar L-ring protein n=1 Tax=Paraburkholderia youngii TaxID=2782701 RepID=A0ABX2NMS8_9BURK|nr:flagellar basal body L-ring protein FlgH [Paraburkholderia youngii]NUX57110.1 flagellar basal body L-ring protein FlgH [Paraburkholderia youngii]NVI05699.1 flagellar basal body L-ring protein FlgH [Paraburkholderia youngii]